jgi:deazaflavin-dependent oxidoreductase (nitroreductase family)
MAFDQRPKRVMRRLYRAPIWLYRVGFGTVMGGRLLMLTHRGRKSGLPRYAVLEVIHRDDDTWYVPAAYGERADWYRNILADPHVQVNYRGQTFDAVAETVPVEQAERILAEYEHRHPRAARTFSRLIGVSNMAEAARRIPIVALRATL